MGSVSRCAGPIQRVSLTVSTLILLFVTLLGQPAALARYEQRRSYQESPLSPVATPLSSSLPASLTVTVVTDTAVLTATASTSVTTAFTSPLAAPSTATLTTVMTAPVEETTILPVATTPMPTADLINQGQTSLLLVAAVLGGILVVIAVVLGRQR